VLQDCYNNDLPGIRSAARLCDVFFRLHNLIHRETLFPVGFLSPEDRAQLEEAEA